MHATNPTVLGSGAGQCLSCSPPSLLPQTSANEIGDARSEPAVWEPAVWPAPHLGME